MYLLAIWWTCGILFAAPAHEHHVIAMHRHGHHLGGLPIMFWGSLGFLIVIFHMFLVKLIYNEYCVSPQDRYTRTRYSLWQWLHTCRTRVLNESELLQPAWMDSFNSYSSMNGMLESAVLWVVFALYGLCKMFIWPTCFIALVIIWFHSEGLNIGECVYWIRYMYKHWWHWCFQSWCQFKSVADAKYKTVFDHMYMVMGS